MDQMSLAMMDEIVGVISQSEEWNDIQMTSPAVVAAMSRMNEALEKARELLPKDIFDEVDRAQGAALGAIGEAAILYGIHVADVIRSVAANPADLSRYILAKGTA